MTPAGRTTEGRARARSVSRRHFLALVGGSGSVMLLAACGGATQAPAPKPTEAPKPAAPAAQPTEATKPAAQPTTQAAAAKAPVSLKGVSLAYLGWNSFIPTADAFIKKQIEDGFMKETGATVSVEFINANDVQPKMAAAIQTGSGPDIVHIRDNWAHTYQQGLADLTDVVEEYKQQVVGELYPAIDANTKVDGKYLAMPHDNSGGVIHWRRSWFKDAGADNFPASLDEYHAVGKKLKANGHPFGQALGHSFGDPPGWCYGMMWGYGGREVDEQGRVAINSPETIAAVTAMRDVWKDVYDETGLAWDDSANNRAFLAETISATSNGSSIWFVAKNDKLPFFDDIGLDITPKGPKGQFLLVGTDHYVVPKYTKNLDAAKEFLRWLVKPENFVPRFEENQSYLAGVSEKHDASLPWDKFPPVVQVFKEVGKYARPLGWPGLPSQKAGLAWSKYIVVDMFARAVQGEAPEAAVKWAEGELKTVYA
jgi:multiple sugar transport system substrate-binding protein